MPCATTLGALENLFSNYYNQHVVSQKNTGTDRYRHNLLCLACSVCRLPVDLLRLTPSWQARKTRRKGRIVSQQITAKWGVQSMHTVKYIKLHSHRALHTKPLCTYTGTVWAVLRRARPAADDFSASKGTQALPTNSKCAQEWRIALYNGSHRHLSL